MSQWLWFEDWFEITKEKTMLTTKDVPDSEGITIDRLRAQTVAVCTKGVIRGETCVLSLARTTCSSDLPILMSLTSGSAWTLEYIAKSWAEPIEFRYVREGTELKVNS